MNTAVELRLSLQQVIDNIAYTAKDLREVLTLERAALLDGDTEQLDTCTSPKLELMYQLENLEQERLHLGQILGPHTLEQDLENADKGNGSSTAHQGWADVLDILQDCEQLNQDNGALVQARMQYLSMALEALGQTQSATTYDMHGKTQRSGRPRPLASV